MQYLDEDPYDVELGYLVEIHSRDFEPEEAEVVAIGRRDKMRIRYLNENIRPRTEWVAVGACAFIAREAARD